MNSLPPQYEREITIDSKVNRIFSPDNCNLPPEINTIEDMLIKRSNITEYNDEYINMGRIMKSNICLDDINDSKINTKEDLRLSLFSLLSNSKITADDGQEYTHNEKWGSEIYSVSLNNLFLLARPEYFNTPNSFIKPDIDMKNSIIVRHRKSIIYLFTNATKSQIKKIPQQGLPDNKIISGISPQYLDCVRNSLNIGKPENNIDLIKSSTGGLSMIESEELDLIGLIAPRIIDAGDDEDMWKSYFQNHEFDILI